MRNDKVECAVNLIIERLDQLANGKVLGKPASIPIKKLFDSHAEMHGGSVRLACVFFAAYAVVDKDWDFKSIPIGVRGQYGDKKLAVELSFRHVTFHKNITAFAENLGWKGAVRVFDLSKDIRFTPFLAGLEKLSISERKTLLNHIIWQLQVSRVIPQALPPLPATYLSYARSLNLCELLISIPSEGHIQQFLVAAFLEVHRKRFGHKITTHHPHASDKYDGTTGDIEEFRDGELVAAYEVTVRSDWKNRLADFRKKLLKGKLSKYIIFAANVRNDTELHPAKCLIDFVKRLPFDLAVVDLLDFFSVFCAELSHDELSQAFNRAYQLLSDQKLSGREDILARYRVVTDAWLES